MANKKLVFAINWTEVETLAAGRHDNPHHILGMHETTDGVFIILSGWLKLQLAIYSSQCSSFQVSLSEFLLIILLAAGRHDNPHHILGMHETTDGVFINAYFPGAKSVTAVCKNTKTRGVCT